MTRAHNNAFKKRRQELMEILIPLAATAPAGTVEARFVIAEDVFEPVFENRHVFFDRLAQHAPKTLRWGDGGDEALTGIINALGVLYEKTPWPGAPPLTLPEFFVGALAFMEIPRPTQKLPKRV